MSFKDTRHIHIARNMFFVSIFLLGARLAGALKEVILASEFGTSAILDTYLIVLTILFWLPSMWASLADAVLIPIYNKLPYDQRKLFNQELTFLLLIAGLLIVIAIIWLLPERYNQLPFHIPETQTTNFSTLIIYLSPIILLTIITHQLSTQLLAEEKHINTLLNGIPPLVLSVTLLAYRGNNGIESLIIGSLMGSLLHLVALFFFFRRSPYFGHPTSSLKSEGWNLFQFAFFVMSLSNLIMSVIPFANQSFASMLGEGNVSSLGYATRITALVLGLGAVAIGRAILPILSKTHEISQKLELALYWYRILFLLGVISGLILWYLSPYIIKILFERGAFTSEDTKIVSSIFRYDLLQIPFYFSGIVLVQYFASQRAYIQLLSSSIIAVAVKILSAYFLSETMGVQGIALSTAVMYLATFSFFSLLILSDHHKSKSFQN